MELFVKRISFRELLIKGIIGDNLRVNFIFLCFRVLKLSEVKNGGEGVVRLIEGFQNIIDPFVMFKINRGFFGGGF